MIISKANPDKSASSPSHSFFFIFSLLLPFSFTESFHFPLFFCPIGLTTTYIAIIAGGGGGLLLLLAIILTCCCCYRRKRSVPLRTQRSVIDIPVNQSRNQSEDSGELVQISHIRLPPPDRPQRLEKSEAPNRSFFSQPIVLPPSAPQELHWDAPPGYDE